VLKSLLKASGFIACLAWTGIACAAGLGAINVVSSLGQPLRAEIEVVSVDRADKASLRAKLASADSYKNAGVDYPYSIPKLKFQIEERANGDPYIKVTTTQPVNEPFVSLLVELSWPTGKLLREYTFLIDPPDYKLEQPKAEEVKPIEPVLAAPAVETAPIAPVATPPAVTPEAASAVAAAPAEEAAPVEKPLIEQAPAQEPTLKTAAEPSAAQDALSKEEAIQEAAPAKQSNTIAVKNGDSLSKIAAQIKPADVSLERMLVALYRENAGAFDAHNMNRIRAGKILNLPQSDAIKMLPQADAEEEIRAQAADWNAYRQKLAAAHAETKAPADKQEAAGKITAAVTDKAVSEKEPAKEVLKLSKGEAPNGKVVGGGKPSVQEKAIAKEEDDIAKNKALKEAQERTAILEKNVKEMQKLAELKKQAAASAPAPAPAPAPAAAVAAPLAASSAQAASSAAAAKPKPAPAKPKPAPKVVEQPSLIDQFLSEPLYMAAGAAVVLVLGGLGFVVVRRRKQGGGKPANESASKPEGDVGSSTGRIAEPIAPSPDTGDFTHSVESATAAEGTASEEVDPIGEADLFLTFGRDAQAEEVLKEALKKNPNDIPVKLKLLSIYVSRKDSNSFYTYAREIKESGNDAAWQQTVAMGREIDPSNPFYGGSGGAAPAAAPAAAEAAAPAVDFDLGFGTSEPTPAFASQNTVVLEKPSPEKTSILSSEELRSAAQATPMDFDITGTNPGTPAVKTSELNQEATTALNMDDLVFDVTATHSNAPITEAAATPATPATADDGGLSFTLDFPTDIKKPEAAPAKLESVVPDFDLGDISLNIASPAVPAASGADEPKDERWHEVATKLDLAKAYQEMGDGAGAREILEEVLRDGDDQQRETAQTLMQQL